ncbi:unnamed protein product, partial [marine sediment metagenome]
MSKREFGILPDGRSVNIFVLQNANGVTAEIIEYGASIVSLKVPDRKGNFQDVLLGYETLPDYLNDPFYLGCIVGRCGGRIKNGRFSLSGSGQPGSLFYSGESLTYRVSWSVFRLGTIQIEAWRDSTSSDTNLYKVSMLVKSNPGIPFIDISELNETLVNASDCMSRTFSARHTNDDED